MKIPNSISVICPTCKTFGLSPGYILLYMTKKPKTFLCNYCHQRYPVEQGQTKETKIFDRPKTGKGRGSK